MAPMTELVDSLSRLDAEIVNKWNSSVGWTTELIKLDSLSSSDDGVGGCHLVLIWLILDPFT